MFTGEAKADKRQLAEWKPNTLTTSANISEGQTREIVGYEHKGQNAYGLILGGDTKAGRDVKV